MSTPALAFRFLVLLGDAAMALWLIFEGALAPAVVFLLMAAACCWQLFGELDS